MRYNDYRTKSNAALSMREDSLWVLPANKIEGVVLYGYTKNLPSRHLRPFIEGRMAMLPLPGKQRATAFPTRKI